MRPGNALSTTNPQAYEVDGDDFLKRNRPQPAEAGAVPTQTPLPPRSGWTGGVSSAPAQPQGGVKPYKGPTPAVDHAPTSEDKSFSFAATWKGLVKAIKELWESFSKPKENQVHPAVPASAQSAPMDLPVPPAQAAPLPSISGLASQGPAPSSAPQPTGAAPARSDQRTH